MNYAQMNSAPAFPVSFKWGKELRQYNGMTLRDYFAANALPICYQYWMGDYYHPDCPDAEERNSEGRDDFDEGNKTLIAEDAYKIADAMMKAREA